MIMSVEGRRVLILQPYLLYNNMAWNPSEVDYCKCITFGDVFFLAPLAVVSIRQIKYIAKCASI